MPDIVNDDDLSALAAEYVLGTLEADERTRANVLLDVDHGFRGLVRVWERRFGELHLMVEPVDPDARIWQRIKGKLAEPAASPSLVRVESAPAVRPAPAVVPEPPRAVSPEPEPTPEAKADSTPEPKPEPEIKPEPDIKAEPVAEVRADALPTPDPDVVATAEQRLAELINEVEKFKPPTDPSEAAVAAALAEPLPAVPEPEEKPREAERISREPTPTALLVPEDARLPAVHAPAPRPARVGGWRAATFFMTLIAFGLGGLIAAWRFVPDRLPLQLRPQEVLKISGVGSEKKPAQHGTQFEE
jgi:hypothetical protein